jgi:hypothetical protein
MSQAYIVRAGRKKALIDTVMAKIALERLLVVFIETYCIVRAGFHAALTTCAQVLVEYHNSVFSLRDSLFRASFSAGRVVAMPAHYGAVKILQRIACQRWPDFPDMNELDFVVVFLFAGYLAGSAPPAQIMIYYERMLVHCFCSPEAFSG